MALKWSRSKSRRSLNPWKRDRAVPLRERFSKAKQEADRDESQAYRNEVSIVSALDFDPDEELTDGAPLSGKAGYALVVNDDETGFTLVELP